MKESQWLKKPTNDELREQIKTASKIYYLFWFIGLFLGVIIIILGRYIQGLILGFILFLMSGQYGIHQKLDKIRLEIREKK